MSSGYFDFNGTEVDESDIQDKCDDEMNEVYGELKIGELTYDIGHTLREVDPTAYREFFNGYIDQRLWTNDEGEGDFAHDELFFETEEDARYYRREYLGEDDDES